MKRDEAPETGRRFGDYRVVRLLARGGMGRVFEAEHLPSGRVVALKLPDASMSSDATAMQRFRAEGRLLDSVRHPNIVRVFEVGFEGDCPFIVMELLRGETLRAKVERQGPLSCVEVVKLFIPLCDAVATLHDVGVVHRDLKLCNIMLTERSGELVPMILDFGISKDLVAAGGVQTQSGAFVGTPRYLSPEQTLNPKAASPLSDQYGVGIMLYECLTARSPFSAEIPYALMHAILTAQVVPPSQVEAAVEPGLDVIVLRAMQRDPKARFPSMRALTRALRDQFAGGTRTSKPAEPITGDRAPHAPPSSVSPSSRLARVTEARGSARPGALSRPGSLVPPPSSRGSLARESKDSTLVAPEVAFHEVTLHEPRLVLVRRSARQFIDEAEVARERRRIGAELDRLGRKQKRLLVDSRRAPLSTDDRLSTAFTALREEIGRGFERTAVVVATPLGVLQANRLNRETPMDGALEAFDSELEAMAFLRK